MGGARKYDYVIVDAGSAGWALAARLTEDRPQTDNLAFNIGVKGTLAGCGRSTTVFV